MPIEGLPHEQSPNSQTGSTVSLGDFLRARRAQLKKTQRDMGLPSGHIAQIETGKITAVNPTTLIELASSYGFSLSEMIAAGVSFDENIIMTARAIMVGEAVLQLPEDIKNEIMSKLGDTAEKF